MKSIKHMIFTMLVSLFLLPSCTDDENTNTLTASTATISISADGGSGMFTINTDAPSWKIENSAADWLSLSTSSGTSAQAMVSATASSKTPLVRTATLTITAGNAEPQIITVTQLAAEYIYTLSSSASTLPLKISGSSVSFKITTTAPQWTATTDADWFTIDKTTGTDATTTVTATATENTTTATRNATITITAQYAPTISISVTQNGPLYPSYNTSPIAADNTGVGSTAIQLAKKMNLGWNLGNTMEVPTGETGWGNPKTTQALINAVKAAGFNTVRIPCAWDSYANQTTAKISDSWLTRVKEVVDYCVSQEMYVMINIHWDGGWLENNITTAKQENVNMKQKAFWEQIATYFRDYDEHLIFAGTNEPNADDANEMSVLLSYEQTFINAVRSTGGRNAYRNLIIQGPSTDVDHTNNYMNTLPTDVAKNRLMLEVHYYTPWQFCGLNADADWGNMAYFWGQGNAQASINGVDRNAATGEAAVISQFAKMKSKFVDKGIPVILGEYGAIRRTMSTQALQNAHDASRAAFLKHVTAEAKNHGLIPIYWDNGYGDSNPNDFAVINRLNNTVYDQKALTGLTEGAAAGVYPF